MRVNGRNKLNGNKEVDRQDGMVMVLSAAIVLPLGLGGLFHNGAGEVDEVALRCKARVVIVGLVDVRVSHLQLSLPTRKNRVLKLEISNRKSKYIPLGICRTINSYC